jgi:hypothetical protein
MTDTGGLGSWVRRQGFIGGKQPFVSATTGLCGSLDIKELGS